MFTDVAVSSPSSYPQVSKFQYWNRGCLSWNICPDFLSPLEKLPAKYLNHMQIPSASFTYFHSNSSYCLTPYYSGLGDRKCVVK